MFYMSTKQKLNKKVRGAITFELIIFIVGIGLLAVLSLSSGNDTISTVKEAEAKLELNEVKGLQEIYYMTHSKYASSLSELRYKQGKLITDGGTSHYKLELVETSTQSFKARATAVVDFAKSGNINVWEINQDGTLTEVTPF